MEQDATSVMPWTVSSRPGLAAVQQLGVFASVGALATIVGIGVAGPFPGLVAGAVVVVAAAPILLSELRACVLIGIPALLFLPSSLSSGGVGVPDMTPLRATVAAAFFAALVSRRLIRPPAMLSAAAVAYSISLAVVLVLGPSVPAAREFVSLGIGAFAPALLALAFVRRRKDAELLLTSLLVVACAAAGLALMEFALGRHFLAEVEGVIFRPGDRADFIRAQATYPHPIVLGSALVLCLPIAVRRYLSTAGLRKGVSGAIILLLVGGLFATLSRGPWIAAVISLLAFAALVRTRARRTLGLAVVAVVSLVFLTPFGSPVRASAHELIFPSTREGRYVVEYRSDLAAHAWEYGVEHPFAPNLDPNALPFLASNVEGTSVNLSVTIDNAYARAIIHTGLVPAAALVLLLLLVAGMTFRAALAVQGADRLLLAALFASQVALLVVSLTVATISWAQLGVMYWLIAGCSVALARVTQEPSPG